MNLKDVNEYIRINFADKRYFVLNSAVELSERTLEGVSHIKANIAVSKSNGGLSFISNVPELSKPFCYKLEERIYSIRFDEKVLSSVNLLRNLVSDFLEQVNTYLNNDFRGQDLIGTTFPTLTSPGFEGQFIREIEPGIYEMRVYTDLTPKK